MDKRIDDLRTQFNYERTCTGIRSTYHSAAFSLAITVRQINWPGMESAIIRLRTLHQVQSFLERSRLAARPEAGLTIPQRTGGNGSENIPHRKKDCTFLQHSRDTDLRGPDVSGGRFSPGSPDERIAHFAPSKTVINSGKKSEAITTYHKSRNVLILKSYSRALSD